MAYVVGPRNLGQGFTSLPSRQCFRPLMFCQRRLSTKLHASNLCSLPAFRSPGQDQMPLELGQSAQDVAAAMPRMLRPSPLKSSTTMRRRRISASVPVCVPAGIPRSSVHRAVRAMARVQAKQEADTIEIMKKLLGKRLSRQGEHSRG